VQLPNSGLVASYFRKALRRFPLTRESTLRAWCGPLRGRRIIVAIGDDYLSGVYEEQTVYEVQRIVRPHHVVWDIGANAGYLTMVFAALCHKVHAFEPLPLNISRWLKHMRLNGVANASLHRFAICESDRELTFNGGQSPFGNTYVHACDSRIGQASHKVIGRSIDSLVADGSIEPPDVLKIDVEGAEHDVLRGAMKTISTRQPLILLATHDCHSPHVQQRCLEFLTQRGYYCRMTEERKIIPGLNDFICYPSGSSAVADAE
jgi:FkbM family methyltransferase